MPRGRPRKVDPEILPPEDEQPRGRKKLVEAEHTIKYSAPVPVTVEETTEEGDLLFEDDPAEVEKKQKRKTAKTEREELRKKMMNHGVTAASTLRLIIERYLHSDGPDSGTMAEKSHCTKYGCTEAHVLNQDYMDVAARWGAGRYWFTLYKDFAIVSQWEKRLEPPRQTPSQIIQHSIPGDPTSPQVIVQMPQGDQSQVVFDPVKAMKEQTLAFKQQLENYKLMRDVFGPVVETGQQNGNPVADPDTAFVHTLLTDNTKLKEKISNGLIGQIFGNKAVEDDPSWGAVVMKAVEKGEVSQAINALGQVAAMLLDRILPRKDNNNGQAQMAQTNVPVGTTAQLSGTQAIAESEAGGESGDDQRSRISNSVVEQDETVTPEKQALQLVIDHCQKKLPPQIAFTRLMSYADAVNEQAPHLSIDGYIDMFGAMSSDAALEYVKTLPNGAAVASLEHAKEWTESLQKLIQESQEGGEE